VLALNAATGRYEVQLLPPADSEEAAEEADTRVAVLPANLELSHTPVDLEPLPPPPEGPCTLDPLRSKNARDLWRAHAYGLANALWKREEEATVAEAIELAEALLWDDQIDNFHARNFLLNILLEAGRWEAALLLLHAFGARGLGTDEDFGQGTDEDFGQETDVWAWTSALLHMRILGPSSARARKAVVSAVKLSSYALPVLALLEPMPEDAHASVAQSGAFEIFRMAGVPVHCTRLKAVCYAQNYGRHFQGAGDAFVAALRAAGQPVYEDVNRVMDASLVARMAGDLAEERDEAATLAQTALPKICAHCHAVDTPDTPLSYCSKCMAVCYCSRTCQRESWTDHKTLCKELSEVAEATAAEAE